MLSRIHDKLGTAGLVVAVVALVAALAGTAIAAGGSLTSKQKKEVKKIAKSVAVPGPAGPQGPAGAKGDTGAKGDKGDTGAEGKQGPEGKQGKQGEVGEAGVCSEANPNCVAPSGATFTGAWGVAGSEGDFAFAAISFPLQVSPAPIALTAFSPEPGKTLGVELKDESAGFFGPFPPFESAEAQEKDEEAYAEACPGSASAPAAAPGFLCLYGAKEKTVANPLFVAFGGGGELIEAANEFGVAVPYKINEAGGFARGSWAVTTE